MKKKYTSKEKHPLPLIYEYMEVIKNKEREKSYISETIPCKKYDTDYYAKLKPYKYLSRLI